MNKKAQAAMEFLMTYGWAILVVLVVIGALAYFGVLDPTATLPEKCFLPLGIHCEEHLVKSGDTGGASFDIRNGLGDTMEIVSFKLVKDQTTTVCERIWPSDAPLTIQNGQVQTLKMPSSVTAADFLPDKPGAAAYDGDDTDGLLNHCDSTMMGNQGTKYKYAIELTYHKEGKPDYKHSVVGELLAKLE